jgi:hypothetical protein
LTLAATRHTRPATKRKSGSKVKTRRKRGIKRRDLPALSLRDPRYRGRVVKSAKAYSRKAKPPPEDEAE